MIIFSSDELLLVGESWEIYLLIQNTWLSLVDSECNNQFNNSDGVEWLVVSTLKRNKSKSHHTHIQEQT